MAVDSGGDIYLTGSAQLPLASSLGTATQIYAPTGATAGGSDALVVRLHLAGSTLSVVYLTLIQGELDDGGSGIAVDTSGNAYVIGSTASLHLPVTSNAFQSTNTNSGGANCLWATQVASLLPNTCGTGFVAKLNSAGALSFLTYFGGNNQTWGQAIGIDSGGNLWLTGVTSSTNFPYSSDAYSPSGPTPAITIFTPYLAEMSADGSTIPFATPIASSFGLSPDLKIDSGNNIYVTGFSSAAPTTPNAYPANLEVYVPAFVQKWGEGPEPVLQISSTALTFPDTPYGSSSPSQTVTLQNTGAGAMELGIQLVSSIYTPGPPPTGFLESDNCGTSLAASASCTLTVTFEPGAPSPACLASSGCDPHSPGAIIEVQTNTPTGTTLVNLGGLAGMGAALSVTPNPIVFLPQAAGTASPNQDVVIQSDGDLSLNMGNASISGPNASDFQLSQSSDASTVCTRTLSTGAICQYELVFSPPASATGTRSATLTLTDNAQNTPQIIPITGTVAGAGPALTVSPAPLFLGTAVIGAANTITQANVTLANPSPDTDLQVTSITVGGSNSADFFVGSGTCSQNSPPFTIAKGTSCYIQPKFAPTAGASGLRTATLTFATSPAVTGLPVIAISGDAVTNTDPSLSYFSVPSPLDFGSLQIGQTSPSGNHLISISAVQPYLCANGVTNCGGPLTINSFVAGISDYTVVVSPFSYCTNPPLTIPAGGNCTVQVNFTPTVAGTRNSTLTINSNDPLGPATLPLLGTGLALPIGSLSVTALNFGYSAIGVASPPSHRDVAEHRPDNSYLLDSDHHRELLRGL